MLEFLGVGTDEECVTRCLEGGSFEKLARGRRCGEEDRASFFRKGVVGDWKNHLDESALACFMQHGGTLLRELGYEQENGDRNGG